MEDNNISSNLASILDAAVELINQGMFNVRGDRVDLIAVTVARLRGASKDLRDGTVTVSSRLRTEAAPDASA